MKRKMRKLRRWFAVTGFLALGFIAWYGMRTAPEKPTTAQPAPAPAELIVPPIELVQMHLIPRTQPTPLSPSWQRGEK